MIKDDITAWQPKLVAIATAALQDDGAHDINHLHRVWSNAQAMMATEAGGANPLVVLAACYLHDLVNLPKNHPERSQASRMSAAAAQIKLAELNFPPQLLAEVAHAIEAHSFSAAIPPRTLEARIVQDADRLDALGAVGLARLFYIAGQMGSALADGADPLADHRPLDDRAFSLDHIVTKLAKLPAMMQTRTGRHMGEQRLALLIKFRQDFAVEWGEITQK